MTLSPNRIAPLAAIAALSFAARWTCAETYTVPDLRQPTITSISTGQVISPSDLQISVSGLNAIGADTLHLNRPDINGAGQTVVVIDTGIDYNHPAISSNYLTGYNFVNNTPDPFDNATITEGHGTHVAGIIASTDPAHMGVAPGVKIIALKVFDNTGNGSDANILAALNWVAANRQLYNITTVNMSLGDGVENTLSSISPSDPFDASLHVLKQAGVFVSVASGNESFLHGQSMPAASKNAVSVGATYASGDWSQYIISSPGSVDPYQWPDANGVLHSATDLDYGPKKNDIAFFTNRYKTATDGSTNLMAPGIFITSSVPIALDTNDGVQDGWTDLAGTSMAAPQVAAAAVLVRQALEMTGLLDPDPAKQVDQILEILQETGTPLLDSFYLFGGNNSNAMEIPIGSGNLFIRPATDEFYDLINVNNAVNSILAVPEPTGLSLLAIPAVVFLVRRRRF